MSIALYFGKINMSSSQLGDVLTNNASFREILSNVLAALKEDITYTYHCIKNVDNKIICEDIEYSLSIKEKNDSELFGYIHKKSYLNYKDFDKDKKEILNKKVQNTETSEFYYDVFREMVGYQRTLRFGYKEFLYAFEGILNNACKTANLNYSFTVNQFTNGIDINDLRNMLQKEKQIQKLKIKYQIPNPDANTLKHIQENPEKTIKDFEDANLAMKYVTYQAFSDKGLNVKSEIIEKEIQNINTIHSNIGAEKAIQNGYVEVETTDFNGITRSTADKRPVIRHIEYEYEFKEAASKMIINYIRNSIEN